MEGSAVSIEAIAIPGAMTPMTAAMLSAEAPISSLEREMVRCFLT